MNPYRYDIQTLERKARAVRRHIEREDRKLFGLN